MKDYSIGDVSQRLGMSRDALRFYERKGIIHPKKLDNGYRSYSYEDLRTLMDIRFYRRINFSIEDISHILRHSSYPSYYSMIGEKIKEEELEIQRHMQSLVHLQYLEKLYKNIGDFLNRYDVRPLRRYFKMDNSNLIDKLDVFDLCYVYQEYRIGSHLPEQVDEYFLLAADTAAILNLEKELEQHLFIQHERCVYTVVASDCRLPKAESIKKAADWAVSEGYQLLGTAYSGFLLSCAVDESQRNDRQEPVYYIELYLPIT